MKGALRLLLLLGFAAIGLFFLRAAPQERHARLRPAARRPTSGPWRSRCAAGRALLRRAEYRFPGGAPRQVVQEVKLPDGAYQVDGEGLGRERAGRSERRPHRDLRRAARSSSPSAIGSTRR